MPYLLQQSWTVNKKIEDFRDLLLFSRNAEVELIFEVSSTKTYLKTGNKKRVPIGLDSIWRIFVNLHRAFSSLLQLSPNFLFHFWFSANCVWFPAPLLVRILVELKNFYWGRCPALCHRGSTWWYFLCAIKGFDFFLLSTCLYY